MPSITLGQSTIHCLERGAGRKCVVLVHGFPLDSRIWDRVLADPPNDVRVIAPDLPAFGKSSTNHPFTMDSLADTLHELLSRIGISKCIMGGFSMGGYVALAFAKKHPNVLSGLMLINTRAEADSAEGKEKRNKMIQTVRTSGSKAIADAMMPNMITKEHQTDSSIATPLRQIMESSSPQAIEFALSAMREREDQTSFLPSISIPTLIIAGEHDAIIPQAAADAMNKAIPRSKLVMIPDAGHAAPVENAPAVDRAIREFISSV